MSRKGNYIGKFPGHDVTIKKEMLLELTHITHNLWISGELNKNKQLNEIDFNEKIRKSITIKNDKNDKNDIIRFGKEVGLWDSNYNLTNLAKLVNKNNDDSIKKYFDQIIFNLIIRLEKNNEKFVYNPFIVLLEWIKKQKENNAWNESKEIDSNFIFQSFTDNKKYEIDKITNFEREKKQKNGTTKKEYTEKPIHFIHLLKNTSFFFTPPNTDKKVKFISSINIDDLLSKCNRKFHNKTLEKYNEYFQNNFTKLAIYLGTKLSWHQKIYYGAPGTGKSYKLKEESENYFYPENIKRITFHPNYSYSNFVGVYKPKTEGNKTVFNFVPGPLINILIEAYEKPDENYLLIIEEINRANVSEVFGDFFQLIERDENGRSQYDINVSEDLKDYLEKNKKSSLNPDELHFPENLYISATMNSSDQGTFPLDTAFKRRWDFEYIGINDNEEEVEKVYFKLIKDDKKVKWNWNSFRKSINEILLDINSTINEDKLLGPFFIGGNLNGNDAEDNTEIIKNKVVPYLYEDVLKYLGREAINKIFNPKLKTLSEIIKEFNKENENKEKIAKFTDIFSSDLDEEIEKNPNSNSNSEK